jgi:hypothetical protein
VRLDSVLAADVSAGIFGLLGVGVGGVVSWLLQRERAKATRQRENERLKREADTAWQLLSFEVGNALETVYDVRRKGQWPIGASRAWAATWQSSRGALLRHPRDQRSLNVVAAACASLDELQSAVNSPRSDTERSLTSSDQLFLNRMQQILAPAVEELGFVGTADSVPLATQRQLEDWEAEDRRKRQPSDDP